MKNKPPAKSTDKKRKAPVTPRSSESSSNENSDSGDKSGSGIGSKADSSDSEPAVPSKGKGKAKAPSKKQPSLPRQRKQASKDTPEPPDFNENAGKRTKKGKGVKLPARRVEAEQEGREKIPEGVVLRPKMVKVVETSPS